MAKKKAAKTKARTIALSFGFETTETCDVQLYLMSIERPSASSMKDVLLAEFQSVLPTDTGSHSGMLKTLMQAEKEGRVLWGWSPWRASKGLLTWEMWDAFCKEWVGCLATTEPREKYGDDKTASVVALSKEVQSLVSSRKLKLSSEFPLAYKVFMRKAEKEEA